MQQPVSSLLQLVEHDNRCPDLLAMDIQCDSGVSKSGQACIDVFLSLTAGTHWNDIAGGRVQVAIAQAHIALELHNATFTFAPAEAVSSSSGITVRSYPDSMPRFELTSSDGSLLKGEAKRLKLGTLIPQAGPVMLTVTGAIAPRDVRIVDAEGLWRHDITPNKHGIIERKLARAIADIALSPYLNRIQFCYQCPDPCPTPTTPQRTIDEASLKQTITAVIDAPTSNILNLAQRAGIVVESDLAGSNFRGASMSGLDLSNVDLSDANLRGVDLTDAELSEANLSRTKLGGADLSGADLGSAILRDADLHRASLALANLSGADLSGANLQDTNLSQANLNGVQVNGALFSRNVGLSEDVAASLKEKGAMIEDVL